MIKKIFFNLILISILSLITIIIVLSTSGIETFRLNKLIAEKINQNKNIDLELETINFKLDLKKLSLFIETNKPKIKYNNFNIPAQNVKVYIDFLKLLHTNLEIKKINLISSEVDIIQLNDLSQFIKPSNFKSILQNKINNGKLILDIEIFFDKESKLKDYIIKGTVKDLEANIYNNLNLSKTKFSFFADKEDILIKNIFGNIDNIEIKDGDIKLNFENGIKVNSNFNTDINISSDFFKRNFKVFKNLQIREEIKYLIGNLKNNIFLQLDDTLKLINYNYKSSGIIKKSKIILSKPIRSNLFSQEVKEISLKETKVVANLFPDKFTLNSEGKYSLNDFDFLNLKMNSNLNNNIKSLKIDIDFKNTLDLKLINYKKPNDVIANLTFNLEKREDLTTIKNLNYNEKNNYIKLKDLSFKKNRFKSINKIEIKTPNNDFSIDWDKKILIKGNQFDARNLPKILNNESTENQFKDLNSNIEINFKNVRAPLSEQLQNFRLIGIVEKGKFIKISSKGDFGGNNFLDISMKKDKDTNKKFLEIYSDLPRPLLTEYEFFKGLSGGKLLFTSLIDGTSVNSKLKIEKFKVVNAPGVIKLLSLADLGGLADLAEGDGLSFDVLEIDMEKNKNLLKFNEILALGPSISVLMEGYQDEKGLTSLKGTLVPAKTLNKMISKIPVIGNIVIPKEVGEGLFGISFKMKGVKGDIKTTINPIRTLTPRFIQKIIDKGKNSK